MDGQGVFQLLCEDDFRFILDYLSFKELCNFRCVSRELENRVTYTRQSLFNTFYIKIKCKSTIDVIIHQLKTAMAKPHAPENLKLWFYVELNLKMEQILMEYNDFITHLNFFICGNIEVFLKPSFKFNTLNSLIIDCDQNIPMDSKVAVYEAMIEKHASKLENLEVKKLYRNLNVPALPLLQSLKLDHVDNEAAYSILEQCRYTITSLDIYYTDIESRTHNNVDSITDYNVPNLKILELTSSNSIQLALQNAETIVSLYIRDDSSDSELEEVPKFPRLRQLAIDYEIYLPILSKNRETIECLILCNIWNDVLEYAVEMKSLTDLIVINDEGVWNFDEDDMNEDGNLNEQENLNEHNENVLEINEIQEMNENEIEEINEGDEMNEDDSFEEEDSFDEEYADNEFINQLFDSNQKTLEFIWMAVAIPDYTDYVKMEKVNKVLLGYKKCKISEQDRDIMSEICPNADVVLMNEENSNDIRNQVVSRLTRKGLPVNLERILRLSFGDIINN